MFSFVFFSFSFFTSLLLKKKELLLINSIVLILVVSICISRPLYFHVKAELKNWHPLGGFPCFKIICYLTVFFHIAMSFVQAPYWENLACHKNKLK